MVTGRAQYILDNYATVDEAVKEMKKLDFKEGAPVMKLELENGLRVLSGDASGKFEKSEPFKWIAPEAEKK